MTPLDGKAILTAAEMRAAEDRAIAAGTIVEALMERAGAAVAEQVRRLAGDRGVLILCGPGNNGGDGYVAARILAAGGHAVRVAASGEPRSPAAIAARRRWQGPVEPLVSAEPAPVLVDALFGTGLTRGLECETAAALARLAAAASLSIAVDLPSGAATDDGRLLSATPVYDLTLALGALKPSHMLLPAAARSGSLMVLDIGVSVASAATVLVRPKLAGPTPQAHKYSRGMVAIIAGAMPGAATLAAISAARGGAGYVLLLGGATDLLPHAVVRRRYDAASLADVRIGALVIGPGLGRDDRARERLSDALASDRPLVIDGDALRLVRAEEIAARTAPTILTPHAGEFDALFGKSGASKIERARDAARASGAAIVFKGADTVIAAPDGAAQVAPAAPAWLSTAGTGDVLAGVIAARLAVGGDAMAAGEGVWLHGEAARRAGAAFIADDLARHLPEAIATCL
ncbi:NAD(P)H-hydrate dehydratase [uncultured Sphingomonas sp.]|uniref:NAD(P)H-hydrate dehydratase n=1 Tax=uncultured Sphingomonas sp. TaxID=158754 RepID=UPI002626C4D2|nr:NAD(P)H-hydrate dehydratase [uncultured Sphingomonas sp.]